MPNGTVKWFNREKGFGFIQPDGGGEDVFLHKDAVARSGMGNPNPGQKVSYDADRDRRGRISAKNVRARA